MYLPVCSVRTLCLDAFIVALNQACAAEGEKRWYASTLELQLASMEWCRVCRSVPTLHVYVSDQSPRSLWFRSQTQAGSCARRSQKLRTSSRVPIVRAVRLTWGLPMEMLTRDTADTLCTSLAFLKLELKQCVPASSYDR